MVFVFLKSFIFNLMGNQNSSTGSSTLKKHIETATKTGVLQYDNKKLKEVRRIDRKINFIYLFFDYL